MREFLFVLILTGICPLGVARLANRDTSLVFACWWAMAAWVCVSISPLESEVFSYLLLCAIASVVVALLGARHPHEGPWNFVVVGFLVIMMFPLAEGLFFRPTNPVLFFFVLASILAVGCLNYLPTRLGAAACVLASGCLLEFSALEVPTLVRLENDLYHQVLRKSCFALAPWLAWWMWPRNYPGRSDFDCLWLEFRNRYGLIWGLRVREQFNRSAANAGWPVQLKWNGLRNQSGAALSPDTEGEMLKTLKGLLQRFMPDQ